jgi:hypothetical protein
MTVSKDELIGALRIRYDHYSAETIFNAARERAQIADKQAYDAGDVRSLRTAIVGLGDRLDKVLAQIDDMIGDAPAASKKEPKAEAKPEPKAEAKPEPKAEAKPEPKADKKEAKADKAEKAAEKSDKAEKIDTVIALKGVDAGEGDQVLVCGGFPELGEWDADKALPMAKSGDEWTATIKVAPDAEIAFKFLRRTADGKTIWEDGENRTAPAKARVEATWR